MLQGISALIWVSKWCVCVCSCLHHSTLHWALSNTHRQMVHLQRSWTIEEFLGKWHFVFVLSLYIWHRWRPFYGMATHTLSLPRPSNRLMAFELNPVSFYFHWFSLHFKTVAHLNTWTLELFSFFHFSLVCKKTVQQKIKTFLLL